jgi:hypothetical protein
MQNAMREASRTRLIEAGDSLYFNMIQLLAG